MKKFLLCLAYVSLAVLLPLAAQTPDPHSPSEKANVSYPNGNPPLDGNYVLTLSTADKKGPDFSVLVAAQTFSVYNTTPGVNFGAQLIPQENGSFLMYYDLTQAGGAVTKCTVILRPGEPVQLLKSGDGFCNARLDHYNPTPAPAPKGGG